MAEIKGYISMEGEDRISAYRHFGMDLDSFCGYVLLQIGPPPDWDMVGGMPSNAQLGWQGGMLDVLHSLNISPLSINTALNVYDRWWARQCADKAKEDAKHEIDDNAAAAQGHGGT